MSKDTTLIRKEANGNQLELKILNKQAEIFLRIVPVALAGGGPVTQLLKLMNGLMS